MKKEDVKVGMEVIMTRKYTDATDVGNKFKILRPQNEEEPGECFVVDHDGGNSFLAPYCDYFEPTDPNFTPQSREVMTLDVYDTLKKHLDKEGVVYEFDEHEDYIGDQDYGFSTVIVAMEEYAKPYIDKSDQLQAELKQVKAEREWISVKDRLPEFGEEFNCIQELSDGQEPVVSITEFDGVKKIFCYPGTDIKQTGITHWQPLPSAPEPLQSTKQ